MIHNNHSKEESEMIDEQIMVYDLEDEADRLILADYLTDMDREEEAQILRRFGKDEDWPWIARIKLTENWHESFRELGWSGHIVFMRAKSDHGNYYAAIVEHRFSNENMKDRLGGSLKEPCSVRLTEEDVKDSMVFIKPLG